jgi:hypothetical protein
MIVTFYDCDVKMMVTLTWLWHYDSDVIQVWLHTIVTSRDRELHDFDLFFPDISSFLSLQWHVHVHHAHSDECVRRNRSYAATSAAHVQHHKQRSTKCFQSRSRTWRVRSPIFVLLGHFCGAQMVVISRLPWGEHFSNLWVSIHGEKCCSLSCCIRVCFLVCMCICAVLCNNLRPLKVVSST